MACEDRKDGAWRRLDAARQALDELYARLDRDVAVLQKASGMTCVPGCGKCCLDARVETTVLDALPLAYEICRRGEEDLWFERLRAVDFQGPCVFYQPDPQAAGRGRCGVYPFRPLICRLFGFAMRQTKRGTMELVTCREIKTHFPSSCDAAARWIEQQKEAAAPVMSHYVRALLSIDPQLGLRQYPINKAVAVALERVALLLRLSGGEQPSPSADPDISP